MPFKICMGYDLLSEAVTKIVEHSKSDRPATIITLGDYVDRGPKSRQVIERLMDWGSPDLKRSASRAITKTSRGSAAVSQSRVDGGWIMVAGPL